MAVATDAYGALQILSKVYISTPMGIIYLKILPEITDSKGANYTNEVIQGRSNPITNFSHSEPNNISTELTFIVTTCQDIQDNIKYIYWIKSLVYPGAANGSAPYTPPAVCKLVCGKMLGGGAGLCVVLKNYNIKGAPDVPWDLETYLPYKVNVSCQWEVVYACKTLPNSQMIRNLGMNLSCACPSRTIDQPLNC